MTPQPVVIHGVQCVLRSNNGGGASTYSVTNPKTGSVLTQQPSRFLAVARAAEAIRTQRTAQ